MYQGTVYTLSHVWNISYSVDTRDCSATGVKDVDFLADILPYYVVSFTRSKKWNELDFETIQRWYKMSEG